MSFAQYKATRLLISGVLLFFCISNFVDAKKIQPMTDKDLTGVWVGFTNDELYYYRFSFTSDGQGYFAWVFLSETAYLYRITSWKLSDREIKISAEPLDDSAYPIIIEGKTGGPQKLELIVRGTDWSRTLSLRREDDLEKRASLVKMRMYEVMRTIESKD